MSEEEQCSVCGGKLYEHCYDCGVPLCYKHYTYGKCEQCYDKTLESACQQSGMKLCRSEYCRCKQ